TLSGCVWGCGATEVKLRGVELVDCAIGVEFVQASQNLTSKLWVSDARIVGSTDLGVSVYDTGGGSELELVRTSILLGSSDALRVVHDNQLMSNTTHAIVRDCLFAFHTGDGIKAELATDNIANSALRVEVERSTLAHNDHGIDAYAPTGWWPTLTVSLADSIVVGNLDDVYENPAKPAFDVVRYCDIGDGDFAGTNGNFAADPLFVDPSNLDYRLRWASPCIETGDPAGVAGDLDLAGNARPIDGDLDAQERFDLGAFEFAPLFLKSTGELGSPLALELWGPQANATTVYFARKPLVAPQLTPFGELDLDAAFMNVFRVTTVGSGPPKTIKRTIPNDPAFAGLVFSFQALTDCAAAPQGKAYTNAVELTLVP
ncbi:MAG: hypothetical protein IT459_03740, partial [Planctomycetes bacterium]|nr:hypothetical protein [Planctomycetota bacterium]